MSRHHEVQEDEMKIRYAMSCPVRSVSPTETLEDAAALMADCNIGALPVMEDGRLVGIVTDRDLAVRGIAAGLCGETHVSRVMTEEPRTCGPDDEFADVLAEMGLERIRRMPVCSSGGDLVGIVSLGDAARHAEYLGEAAETLADICRPPRRRGKDEQPAALARET